jgi:hypothetical protein
MVSALERPPAWSAGAWEGTLRLLQQDLHIIEKYYAGGKPIVSASSIDLISQAQGKLIAKWIEWYMTVYYHYAWAERVQQGLMEDRVTFQKNYTEEQLQIFNDSIKMLSTDYARRVNASAKQTARLATMQYFRYVVSGRYRQQGWNESQNVIQNRQYVKETSVLGAAVMATPHLVYPKPLIVARILEPHILTGYGLRDLIAQDSKSKTTIPEVWTHSQELVQIKDRLLGQIEQEVVKTIQRQAQAAAVQAAEEAGIVELPTTPFYQKPLFTLAAAGGIFLVGYTVLRGKK